VYFPSRIVSGTFAQGLDGASGSAVKTRVVIIGYKGNRPDEPNMEFLESRHQEEVEEATV